MNPSILAGLAAISCLTPAAAQDTLVDAKRKRLKDTAADFWIYDDVERGYAEAKAKAKPLLVSFRCVP